MIENPVFIVGTERSGSNLLRVLLNELPGITVPHPPHLMRDLSPRLLRYGNLTRDANARRLVHDAIQLVNLHFAPWPMPLDAEAIFRALPKRDLYSVYATIYEAYRVFQGKPRWGCKSTFMVHHVPEILEHHARPQFIHLVRDVRDVAVSARRSVFSHYHPYLVAKLWQREQAIAAKMRGQSIWHTLCYEDLLAAPEQTMRELCGFLGEPYSPEILNYFERKPARDLASLSRSWQNVARPILQTNTAQFKTILTRGQIQMIEDVARTEMTALGYETITKPSDSKPPGPFKLQAQENAMMLVGEARALWRDRNAVRRFRKKFYLRSLR